MTIAKDIRDDPELKQTVLSSRIVGAATAGSRALFSQFLTFYVRVPVKLFRPTRVEYVLNLKHHILITTTNSILAIWCVL